MQTVLTVKPTVKFTRHEDGTREEFLSISRAVQAHVSATLADRILGTLCSFKDQSFGLQVDWYEHSLQTATRAHREGARIDLVVGALLHDIGDAMAPHNHAEAAAAILAPFVDEETTWIIKHHAVFQGYHFWDKLGLDRNARDRYRGNPYFDSAAHFCAAWDQMSCDPNYESLPLEFFEPMVREVFGRPTPMVAHRS